MFLNRLGVSIAMVIGAILLVFAGPASSATGTGLDQIVDIVLGDADLAAQTDPAEILEGAEAAEQLNEILVEAIVATGAADRGSLTPAGIKDIRAYIIENHGDEWLDLYGYETRKKVGKRRRAKWVVLEETGIHLIQDDGATTELFGVNALRGVAYPIYSIYLPGDNNLDRFKRHAHLRGYWNKRNKAYAKAAEMLNQVLSEEDFAQLHSGEEPEVVETGTGYDEFLDIILYDTNLNNGTVTNSMINEGLVAASRINAMQVAAILATGAADDGIITPGSLWDIDAYIRTNFKDEFEAIHGDEKTEAGLHAVVDAGSSSTLFGQDAISRVMDSIYHLGFGFRKNRIKNEAGIPLGNVHIVQLAGWLDQMLSEDMEVLHSGADPLPNLYTGTGLDRIITTIVNDQPSYVTMPRSRMHAAVEAAYRMNLILLYTIEELGVGDDGHISSGELKAVSTYIHDEFGDTWKDLRAKTQPLMGKPRLHLSAIPGEGRLSALIGGIHQIGTGIYPKGQRKFGRDGIRGAARVWEVAGSLNMWLYQDYIADPVFVYSNPRRFYGHFVVNHGDVYEQAMAPQSDEEVQQKMDDYIDSLRPQGEGLFVETGCVVGDVGATGSGPLVVTCNP